MGVFWRGRFWFGGRLVVEIGFGGGERVVRCGVKESVKVILGFLRLLVVCY